LARAKWDKLVADDLLRDKHNGAYANYAYFIKVDGKRFTCTLCNKQLPLLYLRKHIRSHWTIILPQLARSGLIKAGKPGKQAERLLLVAFTCECGYTVKHKHPLSKPLIPTRILRKLKVERCPRCGRASDTMHIALESLSWHGDFHV